MTNTSLTPDQVLVSIHPCNEVSSSISYLIQYRGGKNLRKQDKQKNDSISYIIEFCVQVNAERLFPPKCLSQFAS